MKLNYNHKTKRFSICNCNLTENEANAILRSLSIVVDKMDYNEELGFYTDNGDCFSMPTESYKAAERLFNQLSGK